MFTGNVCHLSTDVDFFFPWNKLSGLSYFIVLGALFVCVSLGHFATSGIQYSGIKIMGKMIVMFKAYKIKESFV